MRPKNSGPAPADDGSALAHLLESRRLPSPRGVVLRLLRIAEDEEVDLSEVARIVEADPALAGRLLQLANSTSLGLPRKVASISAAVSLLGAGVVKNLALGLSLAAQRPRKGFDYERFWSACLARAVAARVAAEVLGAAPPSDAFTMGLLRDVGHLAMTTVYAEPYEALVESHEQAPEAEVLVAERARFGLCRYEVSAALMRRWGLPEVFAEATDSLRGVAAKRPRSRELAELAELAGWLGQLLVAPAPAPAAAAFEGAAAHDLSAEEVEQMLERIGAEWQEAGGIFAVPTGPVPTTDTIRALTEAPEADRAAEPDEEARLPSVLVVDDDAVSRRMLQRQLTRGGFTVHTAEDGLEALEVDRRVAPSIVVTDWMMPNMDGLELCEALRKRRPQDFLHVIMLTSAHEEDRLAQAFAAGADDFLRKPYSKAEILARLRAAARIVRLEAERAAHSRELMRKSVELEEANAQLRKLAYTDALTGLVNRRQAFERLDEAWALSERNAHTFACILADIDHFKRVNDTHGHDVGDQVLVEVGERLRRATRTGEIACRIGGEEFLVICPMATEDDAAVGAERLRRVVAEAPVPTRAGPLTVTFSLGVAARTPSMERPTDLYTGADDALYAAKEAGRNRVCKASALEQTSDP